MKALVKKNSRLLAVGILLSGICLVLASAGNLNVILNWQLWMIMAGITTLCLILVSGASGHSKSPFKMMNEDPFKTNDRQADTLPQNRSIQSNVTNLDALYELSKGSTGFIKEMIGIFIEQSSVDIRRIDNAIREGDFETIHNLSHRMKGTVSFIGLKSLTEPLKRMETCGIERRGMEDIRLEFAKVKAINQIAVKELQEVMTRLAA